MEFNDVIRSIVDIEHQSHALQNPMRRMLGSPQIGHEDLPHSHGVLPVLGDVDWSFEIVLNFELAGLGRNDLDDRHLANQLLRSTLNQFYC